MTLEGFYDELCQLDVHRRVAIVLVVGEDCARVEGWDETTARIADEALDLAWACLGGAKVDPHDLAIYVDAGHEDADRDLGVREVLFADPAPKHAVIAVTMAVGYAARKAYEQAGRTDMSEPIGELEDHPCWTCFAPRRSRSHSIRAGLPSGCCTCAPWRQTALFARRW